jgi:hypothetical protein
LRLIHDELLSTCAVHSKWRPYHRAINLHLHALGKCISALSSSSAATHVPYRESKLTRLLKDSFGGSAKTSLIVTIGPRRSHHSETAAALAFGQRALKIENTLKVKEEVDFKLSSRRLQAEVDRLTRELESAEGARAAAERRCQELQHGAAVGPGARGPGTHHARKVIGCRSMKSTRIGTALEDVTRDVCEALHLGSGG